MPKIDFREEKQHHSKNRYSQFWKKFDIHLILKMLRRDKLVFFLYSLQEWIPKPKYHKVELTATIKINHK
jgi:hypothetical protein